MEALNLRMSQVRQAQNAAASNNIAAIVSGLINPREKATALSHQQRIVLKADMSKPFIRGLSNVTLLQTHNNRLEEQIRIETNYQSETNNCVLNEARAMNELRVRWVEEAQEAQLQRAIDLAAIELAELTARSVLLSEENSELNPLNELRLQDLQNVNEEHELQDRQRYLELQSAERAESSIQIQHTLAEVPLNNDTQNNDKM